MNAEVLLANLERCWVAMMTGAELAFTYTNYRGEVSDRRAKIRKVGFVTCDWHAGRQWIADGTDLDKGQDRSFAVRDMLFKGEA